MVKQARARATRAAVIHGAAMVFLEAGYARTTMAEVAKAADVTKGALYFHFDSKEALARAVIDEQNRISRLNVRNLLEGNYSAIETLLRLGGAFAGDLAGDPIIKAGIRLSAETATLAFPLADPYYHWVNMSESLVKRAIGEGSLRADVDARKFANLLVSAYTGIQLVSEVVSRQADLEQRIEDMWRLVLPGIAAPGKAEELACLPQLLSAPDSETGA